MKKYIEYIAIGVVFPWLAYGQANVWVEGLVRSVSTFVSINDRIFTYQQDYEDYTITIGIDSYNFWTTTTYTAGGQVYKAYYHVFRDANKITQYESIFDMNGVVSVDKTPFEIGTDALPITKRQWSCVRPGVTSSSTSTLKFYVAHKVNRYAIYAGKVQSMFEVSGRAEGPTWLWTCQDGASGFGAWEQMTQVGRNSETTLSYSATNLEVARLYGKIKR